MACGRIGVEGPTNSSENGREIEQVGPFRASFARSSKNPYLTYAIPDDGARPSTTDVAALIAAYERRGLHPRLEYLEPCAPFVEPALLAAGFVVEGRLALMVAAETDAQAAPVPASN